MMPGDADWKMQIGPGRLVLVVGPSGSGKDTLIARARTELRNDASVVFPRRVVTRPASLHEDHDSLSEPEYLRAVGANAFALAWAAHGLRYGIPASIDLDLRAARTVVCNASRAIVMEARARYAFVTVALITAPPAVLRARLAARGRASDGSLTDRLAPSADAFVADVVIDNVGAPEIGASLLVAAIRRGFVSAPPPQP
jgi:ribose 1,5-bisphosphokinase